MTAHTRRLEILRQLARAADGLRIGQIREMNGWTAGVQMRALVADGMVDEMPIRTTVRTSQRPIMRYSINEAGRAVLAAEMARETFA